MAVTSPLAYYKKLHLQVAIDICKIHVTFVSIGHLYESVFFENKQTKPTKKTKQNPGVFKYS